jgi:hypothetical protein
MRTTVTLDPDAEALVRKAMRERGLSFKEAINQAIVAGLSTGSTGTRFVQKTHDMGKPLVDLTKALQLFDELETEHQLEVLRRANLETE